MIDREADGSDSLEVSEAGQLPCLHTVTPLTLLFLLPYLFNHYSTSPCRHGLTVGVPPPPHDRPGVNDFLPPAFVLARFALWRRVSTSSTRSLAEQVQASAPSSLNASPTDSPRSYYRRTLSSPMLPIPSSSLTTRCWP